MPESAVKEILSISSARLSILLGRLPVLPYIDIRKCLPAKLLKAMDTLKAATSPLQTIGVAGALRAGNTCSLGKVPHRLPIVEPKVWY